MGKLNLTSGSNCYVATATRGSDRGGLATLHVRISIQWSSGPIPDALREL